MIIFKEVNADYFLEKTSSLQKLAKRADIRFKNTLPMKERLNVSIQSASLILVAAGLAWVVWSNDTTMREMLTYLLILVVFIESLSLYLIGKLYPESHTTF